MGGAGGGTLDSRHFRAAGGARGDKGGEGWGWRREAEREVCTGRVHWIVRSLPVHRQANSLGTSWLVMASRRTSQFKGSI